jgi:hypothetical protein
LFLLIFHPLRISFSLSFFHSILHFSFL